MKKLKFIVLFFIAVVCLTGCGEKSPEKTLEDAISKMSKVKSFHSSTKMEVGSDLYSQVIKIEGDYAKDSSYEKLSITLAGNSGEKESYSIRKEDGWYDYTNENNKGWNYTVAKEDKNNSLPAIDKMAKNYKTVTKVKSEKEGYTRLDVVLDNSKALEILGENGTDGLDPTKDVTMNVYIKDGYIAIVKINLLNTLTEDYAEDITKYSMSIEWSNYNKVKEIELPEEVEKNAQLSEDK